MTGISRIFGPAAAGAAACAAARKNTAPSSGTRKIQANTSSGSPTTIARMPSTRKTIHALLLPFGGGRSDDMAGLHEVLIAKLQVTLPLSNLQPLTRFLP